jgi:hypothetical protein
VSHQVSGLPGVRLFADGMDLSGFIAEMSYEAVDLIEPGSDAEAWLSGLPRGTLTMTGFWDTADQGSTEAQPVLPPSTPMFEFAFTMSGDPGTWSQAEADELLPGCPVTIGLDGRNLAGSIQRAEVSEDGSRMTITTLVGEVLS